MKTQLSMLTVVCTLMVVAAARSATAAPPTAFDFSSGIPADYFTAVTAGNVESTTHGSQRVLVVSDAKASFHDIVVEPATRYTLSLEAAFEGEVESIEENSRFEIFTRLGQTSPRLPSRTIEFLDSAGKPIGQAMKYAMPFKNRHTYLNEFYTPTDAKSVRIRLESGKGIRLILSRLHLAASADDESLNVNPTFQFGPFNYSGWHTISAGGKLIERDGKTVFDTKYGSTGEKIPLSRPGTYALSAKATPNGFNSVVTVRIYDEEGKQLMRTSTRRYGPRTYFVPPPGAAYASFLVYSCLLEEIRLVRVGDERAIQSLQGK